jgi:hypothetical protein
MIVTEKDDDDDDSSSQHQSIFKRVKKQTGRKREVRAKHPFVKLESI